LFNFFILNLSLRGGAMQKLNADQTIPRDKRFFLGGAGSMRGFREDYVGTPSTFINSRPIGGTIFVNYLAEIMIPVFEKFYVALFSDGGNVYADSADFSPSDLRHSAGAGIRYVTPIGPVKLDYGIILDREEGENFGSIHFSLGVF
jgi:outer membrane protein insertion porin family